VSRATWPSGARCVCSLRLPALPIQSARQHHLTFSSLSTRADARNRATSTCTARVRPTEATPITTRRTRFAPARASSRPCASAIAERRSRKSSPPAERGPRGATAAIRKSHSRARPYGRFSLARCAGGNHSRGDAVQVMLLQSRPHRCRDVKAALLPSRPDLRILAIDFELICGSLTLDLVLHCCPLEVTFSGLLRLLRLGFSGRWTSTWCICSTRDDVQQSHSVIANSVIN
jgi:hypothetical protein